MEKNLRYVTHYCGFSIYRNSEGYLECFRSDNNKSGNTAEAESIKRIVTNTRYVDELPRYIFNKKKKVVIEYNPYNDKNQLKMFEL